MKPEKRVTSRATLTKVLEPLGREEVGVDRFRTYMFGGQNFCVDLSANSDEPHLIMQTILQEAYKLGMEDGTFKLKEEIKDLL